MLHQEKPSLNELQHFGVKGMHWGVRRNSGNSSGGSHKKLKRNAKIAGGAVLAVGGAAAAAYLLSKHGSIPAHNISKLGPKFTTTNKHGTSHYGEEAVKAFDEHIWKQQVNNVMWATQMQAVNRLKAPR